MHTSKNFRKVHDQIKYFTKELAKIGTLWSSSGRYLFILSEALYTDSHHRKLVSEMRQPEKQ